MRVIVIISTSSATESRRISNALLKDRLAACVTRLPGAESRYWWKGRITSSREEVLLVKTVRAKMPALIRRVKALHSYDVPEIIAVPVAAGDADYLRWIDSSLKTKASS